MYEICELNLSKIHHKYFSHQLLNMTNALLVITASCRTVHPNMVSNPLWEVRHLQCSDLANEGLMRRSTSLLLEKY